MKKILCFFLFVVLSVDFSFAGVLVMGELTREKTLQPGETHEGTINLKNTGETSCQVNVFQTDYLFYADGSNVYGEPGTVVRSNADWLSVAPNRLTIPPNEMASVYYTVRVPQIQKLASIYNNIQVLESPDLIGTYWSMVIVEPVPQTGPEAIEDETRKVKMGIQTKIRYGIQMVNNIGDTGSRKIKFSDKKLINQDERKFLQMDIENIGERWLSPTLWVEIYDSHGAKVGRFESSKKRIYPGCSVRHKVDLTDVPKGKYQALVVADNGDEYVFGAKYDFGIE
ncbi:MAG: hypothetical protein JSV10_09840 [Candidatus Zixiibacteriota bacterium]|nr:MAG: hypothetical protein JSV10_09840 [candidate division Zixibacteria bacterium]